MNIIGKLFSDRSNFVDENASLSVFGKFDVFLPRFESEVDRFWVAGRLTTFHFIRKITVIIGNYKSTKNNELP